MWDQIKKIMDTEGRQWGLLGIRSVPMGGRVTGVGNKRDKCDESTLCA